jgi:hypothetical protein
MDELLNKLSEKYGLSGEQSYEIFRMILDFLKEKMPDPAGSQINEIIIALDGEENPINALKDLGSKFTTK